MSPAPDRRIRAARGRRPGAFQYIQPHPAARTTYDAVLCKGCQQRIKGLVDDERFEEVREINGQRVVFRRLIMAELPTYVEVELTFDDGSKHVTPMCRECAGRLSVEDAEDFYCADMARWADLERAGGGRVRWDVVGDRSPISWRLMERFQ